MNKWNSIRFLHLVFDVREYFDERVPLIGAARYCLISSISNCDWLKLREDPSLSQASALSRLPQVFFCCYRTTFNPVLTLYRNIMEQHHDFLHVASPTSDLCLLFVPFIPVFPFFPSSARTPPLSQLILQPLFSASFYLFNFGVRNSHSFHLL